MPLASIATKLPEPPVLEVDPFSPENLENPYPMHRLMRDTAPVVYLAKYDSYAVTHYEEAKVCLVDFERFTSTSGIGLSDIRRPGAWRSPSPITEVDPPHHTDVRTAMTRILSPKVIREWKVFFEKVADEVIDGIADAGEVDAVHAIAEGFILKAFPELLGVDFPARYFLDLGEMNFNQLGPNNHLTKASVERNAPILGAYEEAFQRQSMMPGGLGEKIYQAEDAGHFAPGTGGLQVRGFLRAGVDTTIAGIGHTINLLARHPEQWAKVKSDPAKVKGAFDEAIRLESPSQVIWRATVGQVDLGGFSLRSDTKIGNFLGAANRDPRKFDRPDEFDVERPAAGVHLALGAGHHVCIGQMIARTEAEAIIGALVRRMERIEPAGEPVYRHVNTLRTLKSLPLRLSAS
jgi:cytochrome P450